MTLIKFHPKVPQATSSFKMYNQNNIFRDMYVHGLKKNLLKAGEKKQGVWVLWRTGNAGALLLYAGQVGVHIFNSILQLKFKTAM